mgnify:CR=1 FL=1
MRDWLYEKVVRYSWVISEGPGLVNQLTQATLSKKDRLKEGTENPTIIIPGLGFTNKSLGLTHKILREKNHTTIEWCHSLNTGFKESILEDTIKQVIETSNEYGKKVNLVGFSLGGCYARAVANRASHYVNFVLTLGSPIRGITEVNENSLKVYDLISQEENSAFTHYYSNHYQFFINPPVPTTSIYSRRDKVVPYHHSFIEETDRAENIEVDCGHAGLPFSVESLEILTDRLGQIPKYWKKYRR